MGHDRGTNTGHNDGMNTECDVCQNTEHNNSANTDCNVCQNTGTAMRADGDKQQPFINHMVAAD